MTMTQPVASVNTTGTELKVLKNLEMRFREKNPDIKRNTAQSMDWFRKYIPRAYNKVQTSAAFRDQKLWKNEFQFGKMYFFEYDARGKDEMPVWDRYPLIMPFGQYKNKKGELITQGLNFHYLPPKERMAALIQLLKFRTEQRYRPSTRLQLEWEMLKTMSNSKLYSHMFHSYLQVQVKSVLVEIPAQSWEMMLFLPVARFEGDKSLAWRI